jgi:hypothetical protein
MVFDVVNVVVSRHRRMKPVVFTAKATETPAVEHNAQERQAFLLLFSSCFLFPSVRNLLVINDARLFFFKK